MNNFYKANNREDVYKSFQKLSLINSFIFSASTEKPENAKFIAKLIIERATGKKVEEISVTQEKTLLGIDICPYGYYHLIRLEKTGCYIRLRILWKKILKSSIMMV